MEPPVTVDAANIVEVTPRDQWHEMPVETTQENEVGASSRPVAVDLDDTVRGQVLATLVRRLVPLEPSTELIPTGRLPLFEREGRIVQETLEETVEVAVVAVLTVGRQEVGDLVAVTAHPVTRID